MKLRAWSVSQLNAYVSDLLGTDVILMNFILEGEVSNLTFQKSGHVYFTLKDATSKVRCIVFAGQGLRTDVLEEGKQIRCRAKVNLYEREGSFSIIVKELEEIGRGNLYQAFLDLKDKLEKEGLFDPKQKRRLPYLVKRIGVITSPTGAVIRDIIRVAHRRNPGVQIVLYPAAVQGEGAAAELIDGLEFFCRERSVDCIIIGRGGGSYEELSVFNDEGLARSLYACPLPVISAVGHETDVTIADYVADVRASTPSMAAELAVIRRADLEMELLQIQKELNLAVKRTLMTARMHLAQTKRLLDRSTPNYRVLQRRAELLQLQKRLSEEMRRRVQRERSDLLGLRQQLDLLNPFGVLERGYSLMFDAEEQVIHSVDDLSLHQNVTVRWKDGEAVLSVLSKKRYGEKNE